MIVRRELYEAAIKVAVDTIYNPENPEHQMLLSSGMGLLNPLPLHLQTADSSRRMLLLTPKGELVVQIAFN